MSGGREPAWWLRNPVWGFVGLWASAITTAVAVDLAGQPELAQQFYLGSVAFSAVAIWIGLEKMPSRLRRTATAAALAAALAVGVPVVYRRSIRSPEPNLAIQDVVDMDGIATPDGHDFRVSAHLTIKNEGSSSAKAVRIRAAGAPAGTSRPLQPALDVTLGNSIEPTHQFIQTLTIDDHEDKAVDTRFVPNAVIAVVLTYSDERGRAFRNTSYLQCCADRKVRHLGDADVKALAPQVTALFP